MAPCHATEGEPNPSESNRWHGLRIGDGVLDPQARDSHIHLKNVQIAARQHPRQVDRRQFVAQAVIGIGGAGSLVALNVLPDEATASIGKGPIRPPGARTNDQEFQRSCIRCGMCGTVCKNGCIRYFGAHQTRHGALTPYLDVRHRSCILCMRCTEICPTGALRPIPEDLESIKSEVRMGKAVVDPEHCLSYLGRVCGYCHDACPLPGTAIRLAVPALPVVLEGCVGCGRCVEHCPQSPTAIHLERLT